MNQKHDRQEVLSKGLKLFCTKGYSNLGVDEICKSTGMTKGAFYNAFKSKENFLLDSMVSYGSNQVEYLIREVGKNRNLKAADRLQKLYVDMINKQPEINFMGCMINNMMSELGAVNELVGKCTNTEFNKFLNVIEPIVKEAQNEGDFRKDIKSRAIAELLHSTFYGSLTIAKSQNSVRMAEATIKLLFESLKRD
ncbi:MAG: TetR/AcrR family transcriptional regulator [Melioribacteraceae bacterium]|nr:TetR/AcrR family transcriptional regulator [Melioribacteraceae bacterium]